METEVGDAIIELPTAGIGTSALLGASVLPGDTAKRIWKAKDKQTAIKVRIIS